MKTTVVIIATLALSTMLSACGSSNDSSAAASCDGKKICLKSGTN